MKFLSTFLVICSFLFGSVAFAGGPHDDGMMSSEDLRAKAASLYQEADALVEKAVRLESEQAVKMRGGDDVQMRGYGSHQCVMDCIRTGSSLYACRRACGAY